jgi:hypothetical protein
MLPLSVGASNGAFRRIEAPRRDERQASEPSGETVAAHLRPVSVACGKLRLHRHQLQADGPIRRLATMTSLQNAISAWLGPEQNLGGVGSIYNLTMDPFEKYDMAFNGAVSSRLPTASPGKYAEQDNGWVLALIVPT